MKNNKTIEDVANNDLCTGCGTCVGICPNSAIWMIKDDSKGIYSPKINNEICDQCGLCFEVCPGHSVDFMGLNLEIFGKEPEDVSIGSYLDCYIGHATDYDVRYSSASGGIVTQLLIFALEEGIIDGALVTRMSKENPLEPEPFIARTREEIIEASKSKYCPVPANIALKEILRSDEGEKFAVVGLPCHIHGIRKAEMLNMKLKEKIVLHFGIVCGHAPNFRGTEFLLQKRNIRKNDVIKIDYRGEGWPSGHGYGRRGGVSIKLKNGVSKYVPYSSAWSIIGSSYFYPIRCTLCCDKFCELADIAFCDAWLPELADDEIGKSIIISKNKISDNILQKALSNKKIKLDEISSNKVLEATGVGFKKNTLKARMFLFRMCGKKIPTYNSKLLEPSFRAYFDSVVFYLRIYIASKQYFCGFLNTSKFLMKCVSYCIHKLRLVK